MTTTDFQDQDPNDIDVIYEEVSTTKPFEFMETETTTAPKVDLSNVSIADLEKALERAKNEKNGQRDAYKTLVKETVPKAIFKLAHVSEELSNAKRDIFKYFEDVLSLKKDVFGVKEKQQSHTFTTDTCEITIGFRVNDGWDDSVTAGIEKVQNFISGLAKTPETELLVKAVFNLLKKDAKGNLKGSRVLELQKLSADFNNPEFTDGVEIISKAYKPVRSSWFIEAYTIGDNGDKKSIPLSISAADFPVDYSFDFFKNDKTEENAA